MKLQGICLHTNNVPRLADFYSLVLGFAAEGDDTHSVISEANLAIWNTGKIEDKVFSNSERYLTLMFNVEDADAEYDRLKRSVADIQFTSQPTTMPWGCRAFGLKDPDGNNINILSPTENE